MGEHKVQGVDYAYTLQGWLKGINSERLNPTNDMGRDGWDDPSNPNSLIGRDAFGMSLGYYGDNDYKAIDQARWDVVADRPFAPIGTTGTLATEHKPLYNGNIAHTVNTLQPFGLWDSGNGAQGQVLAQVYHYDQLNRLKQAQGIAGLTGANTWDGVTDATADRYKSEYWYDANGNIDTLARYDGAGSLYDGFTYHYHTEGGHKVRNRLYDLYDAATSTTGEDIVAPVGTFDNTTAGVNANNNYRYDALGNLIRDEREEIDAIDWTVSGKVRSIARTLGSGRQPLAFGYSADGQRIMKQVGDPDLDPAGYREHYVRDAQGNIMAVYRYTNDPLSGASLTLNERPIYGSGRLGSYAEPTEMIGAATPPPVQPMQEAWKRYELTDHLGNVAVVVTGRLLDGNGGGSPFQPELLSAQSLEAFGARLPNRSYNSSESVLGLNGQRKDDQVYNVTGTSYTAEFWQYDARAARRWNMDPVIKHHESPFATFANNPIWLVDPNGRDTTLTAASRPLVKDLLDKNGKNYNEKFAQDFQRLVDDESTVYNFDQWSGNRERNGESIQGMFSGMGKNEAGQNLVNIGYALTSSPQGHILNAFFEEFDHALQFQDQRIGFADYPGSGWGTFAYDFYDEVDNKVSSARYLTFFNDGSDYKSKLFGLNAKIVNSGFTRKSAERNVRLLYNLDEKEVSVFEGISEITGRSYSGEELRNQFKSGQRWDFILVGGQ